VTRSAPALLLCLACGCSRLGAHEAPGTYVMGMRFVADTLWVKPDGTYMHVYADGVKVLVASGRWEHEFLRGGPRVTFHRFPIRDYSGSISDSNRTGTWPALFQRTAFGSIVLHVDEDRGVSYRRVSADMLGSLGNSGF
jgi:hypothetical protein